MRIRTLLIAAVSTGLLAAGCGGGDDVTDEEFVASVSEVCDETAAELAEVDLEEAIAGADSPDQAAGIIEEEIVPVFNTFLESLESVDVPEDRQDDFDQLVDVSSEQLALITEDPDSFLDPESAGAQRAAELNDQADDLSSSLGIPADCGEPAAEGASGATGAADEA